MDSDFRSELTVISSLTSYEDIIKKTVDYLNEYYKDENNQLDLQNEKYVEMCGDKKPKNILKEIKFITEKDYHSLPKEEKFINNSQKYDSFFDDGIKENVYISSYRNIDNSIIVCVKTEEIDYEPYDDFYEMASLEDAKQELVSVQRQQKDGTIENIGCWAFDEEYAEGLAEMQLSNESVALSILKALSKNKELLEEIRIADDCFDTVEEYIDYAQDYLPEFLYLSYGNIRTIGDAMMDYVYEQYEQYKAENIPDEPEFEHCFYDL